MKHRLALLTTLLLASSATLQAADLELTETLAYAAAFQPDGEVTHPGTSQKQARVPQNLDELWADFPRLERDTPLEAETLKEWNEGAVVCRVVRFQVGIFKGASSRVAAFYAFPKGGTKLPALLQLHGGGQSASLDAVVTDARRGYAALSLNWGGNKLSFGRSTMTYDGPQTDWGKLDATHPPQRNKANHFAGSLTPDEFTLDSVESPRNSNWFLVLMAARRAVTFLDQQPEVDPTRIGVYGHSMGGKLTTDLAGIEPRIKAAVPSCGGGGDILESQTDLPGCIEKSPTALELACVSDNAYLPRITCPILWLSPTNDFNAPICNMAWNWRNLPDERTRFSIAPHLNHRHTDEHHITQHLWFEQHLKNAFQMPPSPQLTVDLQTGDGIPTVTVVPGDSQGVKRVDIHYSTDPHELTRFWRTVQAVNDGAAWQAKCPVMSLDQPMFAFANVIYDLPDRYRDIPVPAGSRQTDIFALSSRVRSVSSTELHRRSPSHRPARSHDRRRQPRLARLVSAQLGSPAALASRHAQSEGRPVAWPRWCAARLGDEARRRLQPGHQSQHQHLGSLRARHARRRSRRGKATARRPRLANRNRLTH